MRKFELLGIALLFSLVSSAQELKPMKDRGTGLFGYVNPGKEWVIRPSFEKASKFEYGAAVVTVAGKEGMIDADGRILIEPEYDKIEGFKKNGICRLMRKAGRERLWGAASCAGDVLVPARYMALNIDKRCNLIYVRDMVMMGDRGSYLPAWGVFDAAGTELFAPSFEDSPSFGPDPLDNVTDARTLLDGVISADGKVVVPFKNLRITRSLGRFSALTTDFRRIDYDGAAVVSGIVLPGYVKPYDTGGDAVRAAMYRWMCIAERLWCNRVSVLTSRGDCCPLDLDWGESALRFVRLEPVVCKGDETIAFTDEQSKLDYTLSALLYEPDGSFVRKISRGGRILGDTRDYVLYETDEGRCWVISKDVNMMAPSRFDLRGVEPLRGGALSSALYANPERLRILSSWDDFRRAAKDILEQENAGITSYLPRPDFNRHTPAYQRLAHNPVISREYGMMDVFAAKKGPGPGEYRILDRFLLRYEDVFPGMGNYSIKSVEPVWFGPRGNWFIRIEPEEINPREVHDLTGFYTDDAGGHIRHFGFAVNLYDARGRYLRNLGNVRNMDLNARDWVALDELGILLMRHNARPPRPGQTINLLPPPPAPAPGPAAAPAPNPRPSGR